MTAQAPVLREHGNSYNIFILVLTLFSLAIMAVLLLPLDDDTRDLLTLYDNVICVIFLGDFAMNLAGSRPKRPTSSASEAGSTSSDPSRASASFSSAPSCALPA